MPLSSNSGAPPGAARGTSDHVVPLNRSARGVVPRLLKARPSAMQSSLAQDTEPRLACVPRAAGGVGSMLHPWPLKCSASVSSAPRAVPKSPTAVQSDIDGHDTPDRLTPCDP